MKHFLNTEQIKVTIPNIHFPVLKGGMMPFQRVKYNGVGNIMKDEYILDHINEMKKF